MKWENGRQNTTYQKLKLLGGKTWDCYLIKFRRNGYVHWHKDPVKRSQQHFRLNIRLWGKDTFEGHTIFSFMGISLFRPDISMHRVTKNRGRRLILSIGWIKKL